MASNSTNIHRLQRAINNKGGTILYNTTQFYSFEQDRPITVYIVRQAFFDEQKQKTKYEELFSSTSQIQVLLFLRDYWFQMNGWEVPTDNELWNKAKEAYYERRERFS